MTETEFAAKLADARSRLFVMQMENDAALARSRKLLEPCEVCGRSGRAAERCAFGARSGPCSCWRGVPCVSAAPRAVR